MSDVVELVLADHDATVALGRRLGALLRAGDLVVLSGDLGAGKTTLARGIGDGLRVRGPITSPTFVIARRHPSLSDGPDLVHVDAYRLDSPADIDDLDLDLGDCVVVVEWGADRVEHLADSWLRVELCAEGDGRRVSITVAGPRWDGVDVASTLAAP